MNTMALKLTSKTFGFNYNAQAQWGEFHSIKQNQKQNSI